MGLVLGRILAAICKAFGKVGRKRADKLDSRSHAAARRRIPRIGVGPAMEPVRPNQAEVWRGNQTSMARRGDDLIQTCDGHMAGFHAWQDIAQERASGGD